MSQKERPPLAVSGLPMRATRNNTVHLAGLHCPRCGCGLKHSCRFPLTEVPALPPAALVARLAEVVGEEPVAFGDDVELGHAESWRGQWLPGS